MKALSVLLPLSLLLAACSSAPVTEESSSEPVSGAAASTSDSSIMAPAERLDLKGYYEVLSEKEPSLEILKKPGVTFPVNRPDQGYLSVATPELPKGGIVFTLFPGDAEDLVVQEWKSCGTGCSYSYSAYRFRGPAYEKVLLSNLLPMDDITRHAKRLFPRKKRGGRLVPGWPRATHLRLMLAPGNKPIPLYVLREMTFSRREEVSYFDIGTVKWDPAAGAFTFQPRGKAKSLGKLDSH